MRNLANVGKGKKKKHELIQRRIQPLETIVNLYAPEEINVYHIPYKMDTFATTDNYCTCKKKK